MHVPPVHTGFAHEVGVTLAQESGAVPPKSVLAPQ
jgi:hypothetical protein